MIAALLCAAGFLLASTAMVLAVSTWMLAKEQARTAQERDQAARERDRAETNADVAFQVLDDIYLNRIAKNLPRANEIKPEDREFLQKTLRFYQTFADQPGATASTREKSALANGRVGQVQSNLNLYADSEKAIRRALEQWEALVSEFPDVPRYRFEQAKTHHLLAATVLFNQGRLKELETEEGQALEIVQKLLHSSPSAPEYREMLSRCYNGLSIALCELGRHTEAEAGFRRSIEYLEQLVRDFPDVEVHRFRLATTLANFAILLVDTGHPAESVATFRQAIKIHQEVVQQFPDVEMYREHLAAAHENLGVLLTKLGRRAEAEPELRENIALLHQLAEEFPAKHGYYLSLAQANSNLARLLTMAGRTAAAEAEFRRVLESLQRPPRRLHPSHEGTFHKVQAHASNGLAWLQATRMDKLSRNPVEAVSLAQKATKLVPSSASYWRTLGVAQYRAGHNQDALVSLEKSMKLDNGGDSSHWFFVAMTHWQLGDKKQAGEWYGKAVAWMEKNKPQDEELLRFRGEAAELLGIKVRPTRTQKEQAPNKN